MTWRVRIVPDATVDGIAIQMANRSADGFVQVPVFRREDMTHEPGTVYPAPALTLDDALGRALLDALAEHYGNTAGGRQQRADFEHERTRVDKLTDRLLDLLAGGNWQQGATS